MRSRRRADPGGGGARPGHPPCRRPPRRELPRLHPSFRFEEGLAAAPGRGGARPAPPARRPAPRARSIPIGATGADEATLIELAALIDADPTKDGSASRAGRCCIGGALTSAALSLAGAAYVAWRLSRPAAAPMARAVRAVAPGEAGLMPIKLPSFRARRDVYPPDLWTKCPTCEKMLFNKQLDKALRVCPTCGHHFRLSAASAARAAPRPRHVGGARRRPPVGRPARLRRPEVLPGPARRGAGRDRHARRGGVGHRRRSSGAPVAICVMDFGFMGGSMGAVVGEKVTRAAEHALATRIPLVVVSASGGARMQEGTLALMQLAKTLAALERLRDGGVPFMSRPVRPDDRRRVRLVRGGRRRQHRRAERAHRVRRRARLGGHDRPGAAARVPARRVPVRARLHRPGRRPATDLRGELAALLRLLPVRDAIADADTAPDERRRRLPAAVVPERRSPSGSASWPPATPPAMPTGRSTDGVRSDATPSGRASSWPATCAGRGRSSSSRR